MLIRTIAAATAAALLVAAPVGAATKSPKDECLEKLKDVEESRKSSDAGEKAQAEVDGLIEVARHLCEQGNFLYADTVMHAARTMLATE